MPINNEHTADNKQYWYVMQHLDPSIIDRQLTIENEQRSKDGRQALVHIIPFRYLKKATIDRWLADKEDKDKREKAKVQAIADYNNLREYLHDFVFIKASKQEINSLTQSDWNRTGRLHLHHYRTHGGHPIRISDDEMRPLNQLFIEQHQRFSFVPWHEDMSKMETVHIKRGLFANCEANVMELHYTAKGIRLTLGIPVFLGEQNLKLFDCDASDIEVPGRMEHLFNPHFVKSIAENLLDILRRRIMDRDTPEHRLEDQKLLNDYMLFHYLKFDDTAVRNRFQALLLLAASLRRDTQEKKTLIPLVKQMISNPLQPTNEEETFLLAILFEATRDKEYREACKSYCQSHQVQNHALLHLMTIIKRITLR